MNDLTIIAISLIVGGIAGLVRTLQTHGLKLIVPTITFRDKNIKIRLGWIASVVIGAMLSAASMTGAYAFFPEQPPTGTLEVMLWSAIIGFGSLDIVNKWVGGRLGDIDTREFDISTEINAPKFDMITQIIRHVRCVERIHIRDDFRGGTAQIFVVPKPSCVKQPEDAEKIRQEVERIVARIKPIALMVSVELPREKIINLTCKVIVIDGADHEYDYYVEAVEDLARDYIDSLAPGRWVLKNKLMNALYVDRFVQDIRELKTEPMFEGGLQIRIGPDEVARAGTITVTYEILSASNGIY